MNNQLSYREKANALYRVATFRPLLTVSIIALSFLVALLEGVGIGFILPIIDVAQGNAEESSGAVQLFQDLYAFFGVPFTLEFIIIGVSFVISLRYAMTVLVTWLDRKLRVEYLDFLRTTALESALQADVSHFDKQGSDEILNAIITQTQYAIDLIGDVITIFRVGLVSLIYLGIAFYIAPLLTAVSLVTLGGGMVLIRGVLQSGYSVGGEVADANERVQEVVQAAMQGIRDVKLFGMTEEILQEFQTAMTNYKHSRVVQVRNSDAINQFNRFITAMTMFVLVYVGIRIASLSLSSLGLFLFAMFRLGPRVSNLNQRVYEAESNLPHLIRTQEFIRQLDDNREQSGTRSVPDSIDRVRFDDVRFAYDSGKETVLRGVSFEVDKGNFVAFVGPSGAGKSTIVSLLARMYDPDSGDITANGTPIDQFRLREWRSRIAFVPQDPHIFNESLLYNLRIGNRDASMEEVERVCKITQVNEFLVDLPDGYDTKLGDDGVRLSGGQRQRIAIARALLKDDIDLLVLDEATSDLDSHLEEKVHTAIENMERNYAILAIAHRLSTVLDADRIFVMDAGEIIGRGTHRELLEREGKYAELYATQTQNTEATSR